MSRSNAPVRGRRTVRGCLGAGIAAGIAAAIATSAGLGPVPNVAASLVFRGPVVKVSGAAGRGGVPASSSPWCGAHGSSLVGWTGSAPNLPICGPGPGYGGTWSYVDLPGPGRTGTGYYNATPGFQCVELAERWLAVGDGLAPIEAEGSTVAGNYHRAYPSSTLTVDRSPGAVGHAPAPGDVVSFSTVPDFSDPTDGHVAIVVRSSVDPVTGIGSVVVAQENVSSGDYLKRLGLDHWRLFDPAEPADAEFQYPYAAWFHLLTTQPGGHARSLKTPSSSGRADGRSGVGARTRSLVVRVWVAALSAVLWPVSPTGRLEVPALRDGPRGL